MGVLEDAAVVAGDEHVDPVDADEAADVGEGAADALVDLVGRPVDERRRHPGEQVLEGEALAQGVEGVAPVLGVAEHHGPVAHRVEGRTGVDEEQHLPPPVVGVADEQPGADLVVSVAAGDLGEQLLGVLRRQELDQVVAEDVLLVETEERANGRADVADRPVGGDGEHHIADLGQRLVELDPVDQGTHTLVGTGSVT